MHTVRMKPRSNDWDWKSDTSKSITVSLGNLELAILDEMVDIGVGPSRSELMRFCVMFSWGKLQKMADRQNKIMKRQALNKCNREVYHLPDIVFIRNPSTNKYEKFIKSNGGIKNE